MPDAKQIEPNRMYTYGDILKFPEDECWELIDGIPYMQAEPSRTHQYIADQLVRQLLNFLDGKPCRAYSRYPIWPEGKPRNKNAKGYLVPDILVNCDPSKEHEYGMIGAPDLVIKILSPPTAGADKITKFNKYQSLGIKEYWIIEPEYQLVDVYTLTEDGLYHMASHDKTVKFKDLEIDLETIFPKRDD